MTRKKERKTMFRNLFDSFVSNDTESTVENTKPNAGISSYILTLKPAARTDHPMTQLAIVCGSMDLNMTINGNMKSGNWAVVLDRHGKPKVWKKRNYLTGAIKLVSCAELDTQGIPAELRAGCKGTSTQSGWGEVIDTSGNRHRLLYVNAENFHRVLQNGFFDKTASVFVKLDRYN
jgi:hypothetical protein